MPRILLANDDGVEAPGLFALAGALRGLAELFICAPLENQSGVGSALTIGGFVDFKPFPDAPEGVPRMAVGGTPVDAVKYGLREWLRGRPPDLVVSGINWGFNIGRNVRYSGTLGAAFEAAWTGVTAIAVSCDYRDPPIWDAAVHYARLVARHCLTRPPRPGTVLNLNVPALPVGEVKGLRVGGMGRGGYREEVIKDGGASRFALAGHLEVSDSAVADVDGALLHDGYAVLTPLALDWTDREALAALKSEPWRSDD